MTVESIFLGITDLDTKEVTNEKSNTLSTLSDANKVKLDAFQPTVDQVSAVDSAIKLQSDIDMNYEKLKLLGYYSDLQLFHYTIPNDIIEVYPFSRFAVNEFRILTLQHSNQYLLSSVHDDISYVGRTADGEYKLIKFSFINSNQKIVDLNWNLSSKVFRIYGNMAWAQYTYCVIICENGDVYEWNPGYGYAGDIYKCGSITIPENMYDIGISSVNPFIILETPTEYLVLYVRYAGSPFIHHFYKNESGKLLFNGQHEADDGSYDYYLAFIDATANITFYYINQSFMNDETLTFQSHNSNSANSEIAEFISTHKINLVTPPYNSTLKLYMYTLDNEEYDLSFTFDNGTLNFGKLTYRNFNEKYALSQYQEIHSIGIPTIIIDETTIGNLGVKSHWSPLDVHLDTGINSIDLKDFTLTIHNHTDLIYALSQGVLLIRDNNFISGPGNALGILYFDIVHRDILMIHQLL